jgi:molybdopterin molybdotransferase
MIPLEEAFALLDETLEGFRLPTETLPVYEALGKVVHADQKSRLDLPPFNKSAMDGYALLPGDERDDYRLLEKVPAGKLPQQKLVEGTTIKVMTGAAVPEGAGLVVMQEYTEEQGDRVKVLKHGGATNICQKAEDVKTGDVILQAGARLGALEIANLVSCGITEVEVSRQPRLSIISTGDEIEDDPEQIGPGKIMNSNGPMLAALADRFGLPVLGRRILRDDESSTRQGIRAASSTRQGIRAAMEEADIVVLSGGVSVGEFDFVLDALSEAGLKIRFSRVAVKPGKPTVFSFSGEKCAFGLPGNPVSVYVMFHMFVLRAAARMTGARPPVREIRLRLAGDFSRRKTERTQFVPARLTGEGTVAAVEFHGSAHLAAVLKADGLFRVPVGVANLNTGDLVAFSPLPRVFR